MGLVPRFTSADIEKDLDNVKVQVEINMISLLKRIGDIFVKDARENLNIDTSAFPSQRKVTQKEMERKRMTVTPQLGQGEYLDDSANLRSSIGYLVLKNGQIVHQNMKGTSEGVSAAKVALENVPKSGLQLIGVAGMDYTSYVESKGYNVITSQATMAIVNLQRLLQKYQEAVNRIGGKFDLTADFTGVVETIAP